MLLFYGYISECSIEAELNAIIVITEPYKTEKQATKALKEKQRELLNSKHRYNYLCDYWGNQKGVVKLPYNYNIIQDGYIGVKILME